MHTKHVLAVVKRKLRNIHKKYLKKLSVLIKCKMKYINTKNVSAPVKRKMNYMHKEKVLVRCKIEYTHTKRVSVLYKIRHMHII